MSNIARVSGPHLTGKSTNLTISHKELKFNLDEGERAVANRTRADKVTEKMMYSNCCTTPFEKEELIEGFRVDTHLLVSTLIIGTEFANSVERAISMKN